MKYVLIPVKELTRAKQRLAGLMVQEERTALAWLMLEHLFQEVVRARGYDRVAVVTLCEPAAQLARRLGFELISETKQISESVSVDYSSRVLRARGVRSVLRLPIDLPLIMAEDIELLLDRVGDKPAAVMVSSRDGMGTNAIGRTPPDLFPSHFGPDSLAQHLTEARRRNVPFELIDLPRIALDIDNPADLAYFLKYGQGTRVYDLLQTCGFMKNER